MNILSDYDAHKRDEQWNRAEDARVTRRHRLCNVGLQVCDQCGKWQSYCFTHREPTGANRCTCVAQPPRGPK